MLRRTWLRWRNRLLASPRFQRFALACPPLRFAARSHARRLFDLVAGFTYSQTLFACVELDLFRRLANGPKSIGALAGELRLTPAALDRLVGAAAAIRLLDRVGGNEVALGAAGAAMSANPGIAAMVMHHRFLYADLADPVALLRSPGGGAVERFWGYARGGFPDDVAEYSALMAASNGPVAAELLAAYDIRRHRRLLDIGGGEGRFLESVRLTAPELELGLFDLPQVTMRAANRLGPAVALHGGDFRREPLPTGYDCMTLVRVLHDHDDRAAAALLEAAHAALAPGGVLLVAEPMIGASGAPTVGATYFAFYLLAMGQGRARTANEIRSMMKAAGFSRSRILPSHLPLTATILHCVKKS